MKAYLISKNPEIKATLVIKCNDEDTFTKALSYLDSGFWTTVGWLDYLFYKLFKL